MKLELDIDGQHIEADFSISNGPNGEDGAAQLTHGTQPGQTHLASISQPEPGLFVVFLDNRVYRCEVDKLPGGATELLINGRRIPAAVRDKKHLRGKAAGGADATGKISLTSPMPGKIVRLLVGAGDEVAANQGVLIVEAMKMQNEVLSPKAGKVVEIRVTEGQTVNAGETLAVIE